jgi:hypothetical protein
MSIKTTLLFQHNCKQPFLNYTLDTNWVLLYDKITERTKILYPITLCIFMYDVISFCVSSLDL